MDLTRELATLGGRGRQITTLGEDLLGVGVGSGFDHAAIVSDGRDVWEGRCDSDLTGTPVSFSYR